MTNEELINELYFIKNWKCNGDSKIHNVICEAIKALEQIELNPSYNGVKTELEQQLCEDAISREDAINVAIDAVDEWDGGCNTERATMISNAIKDLPPVTPQPSEENILKFYYVESLDDYWIGERMETMYYAKWNFELQDFVWTYSKYLPWGEHVVAPNTLWKEYTYPSEPKEIPFKEWIKGFLKKFEGSKK